MFARNNPPIWGGYTLTPRRNVAVINPLRKNFPLVKCERLFVTLNLLRCLTNTGEEAVANSPYVKVCKWPNGRASGPLYLPMKNQV